MSLPALARRLGHRLWFARVVQAIAPLDRLVGRLTKGRVVALGLLPSMIITTTGRRSGRPRSNPISYVRDGDGFIVIGSNFGMPNHPAWSLNLLAEPTARVMVGGRVIPIRATVVTGPERERVRAMLVAMWPAYQTYERRAAPRNIRIFRLDPR